MSDFVTFARAHGVLIDDLVASERIRRCPTEQNPLKKNGAFMWDGERGFVFAWDGEAKAQWYSDPTARPWTPPTIKRGYARSQVGSGIFPWCSARTGSRRGRQS